MSVEFKNSKNICDRLTIFDIIYIFDIFNIDWYCNVRLYKIINNIKYRLYTYKI